MMDWSKCFLSLLSYIVVTASLIFWLCSWQQLVRVRNTILKCKLKLHHVKVDNTWCQVVVKKNQLRFSFICFTLSFGFQLIIQIGKSRET